MKAYGYFDDNECFHFNNTDEFNEVVKLYKTFVDNYQLTAPCAYYGVASPKFDKSNIQNFSFKPTINKSKSVKHLKPADEESEGQISHVDQLLKKGEKYREKLQHLRDK